VVADMPTLPIPRFRDSPAYYVSGAGALAGHIRPDDPALERVASVAPDPGNGVYP
jgi:hypothetical protein